MFITCIGSSYYKVISHRSLENIAVVGNVGDIFDKACFGQFGKFGASDFYAAAVMLVYTCEDACYGRFSAARLAADGCKLIHREFKVYALKYLSVLIVRK